MDIKIRDILNEKWPFGHVQATIFRCNSEIGPLSTVPWESNCWHFKIYG